MWMDDDDEEEDDNRGGDGGGGRGFDRKVSPIRETTLTSEASLNSVVLVMVHNS